MVWRRESAGLFTSEMVYDDEGQPLSSTFMDYLDAYVDGSAGH